MIVEIFYTRPHTIFGKIICWRTGDIFSHSLIVKDDTYYSAAPFRVVTGTFCREKIICRHNGEYDGIHGVLQSVELTDEQWEKMSEWLNSKVGKFYDVWAIFGFVFNKKSWQAKSRFYCHEFSRGAFEAAKLLPPTKDFIFARSLFREIFALKNKKVDTQNI
jgi:hypothetical protein